jgi:hypothetical protein
MNCKIIYCANTALSDLAVTVVPIEAFRKMLTNSFPNLKEHLWTIPQQFDKFLKKFLTSYFIDQSDCSKIIYKIWLVNETGSWELFKELIKLLRNCSEVFLQVRKWIGQHFSERFYWHDCKTNGS